MEYNFSIIGFIFESPFIWYWSCSYELYNTRYISGLITVFGNAPPSENHVLYFETEGTHACFLYSTSFDTHHAVTFIISPELGQWRDWTKHTKDQGNRIRDSAAFWNRKALSQQGVWVDKRSISHWVWTQWPYPSGW